MLMHSVSALYETFFTASFYYNKAVRGYKARLVIKKIKIEKENCR